MCTVVNTGPFLITNATDKTSYCERAALAQHSGKVLPVVRSSLESACTASMMRENVPCDGRLNREIKRMNCVKASSSYTLHVND